MKALKASICVAVVALALSLTPGAPSWAGEDEASTLILQMKELYRAGKYTEALPKRDRDRSESFDRSDSTHSGSRVAPETGTVRLLASQLA
jgi:hypothetical protein